MMDLPWLPPREYTWEFIFGFRRDVESRVRAALSMAGGDLPPAKEATAQELRWKAEDNWLAQQWALTE